MINTVTYSQRVSLTAYEKLASMTRKAFGMKLPDTQGSRTDDLSTGMQRNDRLEQVFVYRTLDDTLPQFCQKLLASAGGLTIDL